MSSPLTNLGLFGNFGDCDKDIIARLNANFELLDNLVQLTFDDFVDELPESPDEGDKYILSTDGSINMWDGSKWLTYPAQDGYIAYNKDDESLYIYDGSSWNLFSVDVDLSIKKDRSGLNILLNGSFEKDNYLADGWSVTGTGSAAWGDTTLLTSENLKCLDASLDTGDTFSTSVSTPNDCVGNLFEFSGWIGPRSEDIQVDLSFSLSNGTTTIPASAKWEFFKILVESDDTTAYLEFRNADAVSFQIDELFFGPHKKIEAKEIGYNNASSLLSSVDVQGAIDEIAAQSAAALFPVGMMMHTLGDHPPNSLRWLKVNDLTWILRDDPDFIDLANYLDSNNLVLDEGTIGWDEALFYTPTAIPNRIYIRGFSALSPRGIGNAVWKGRNKFGPSQGLFQEDQMQRIVGNTQETELRGGANNPPTSSGMLTLTDSGDYSYSGYSNSGASWRATMELDSAKSPNARTSGTTEGETRANTFGVYWWIRY